MRRCTARILHRGIAGVTEQRPSRHIACSVDITKVFAKELPDSQKMRGRRAGNLEANAGIADGAGGRTLLSSSAELEGVRR